MNKYSTLTPDSLKSLRDSATEAPFSSCSLKPQSHGTYLCRGCGAVLFRATQQFDSHCGWPSFSGEIENAIERKLDPDGRRTEIVCANCKGHLGHVFENEGMTESNIRHCVNSIAIEWLDNSEVTKTEEAIFAAGCFWGVEHLLLQQPGVLKTEVGYTGGQTDYPTYNQVCRTNTGHYEAVRVIFDPDIITYKELVQFFFEIHDPSQANGQGPDLGDQYKSAIFYLDKTQKQIAMAVIDELSKRVNPISTQLIEATVFWPAEQEHQNYYQKVGGAPYCHVWQKKF